MLDDEKEPENLPAVIKANERSAMVSKAVSAGVLGAGSALIGAVNPALGVIVGGLAPFVQASIDELVMRRSARLRAQLDAHGIDLEHMSESETILTEDKILLLQEAIAAALGTDKDEKVEVIIRLLKIGLDAEVQSDVLAARRFARTVSRLDEVELRVILALNVMKSSKSEKASLQGVTEKSQLNNPDLVRSALSSLESEGLIKLLPGALESWSVSDFGRRLVVELTHVFGR